MHRLIVTDALGRRVVSIDKSPFLIGRVEASDLRLAGSQVSRNHAEVVVQGDEVIVRDSESRYGTFVNGARITEHRLSSGDRIRIGGGNSPDLLFVARDQDLPEGVRDFDLAADTQLADLRQIASLLEGLRALGSGRVLQDVLMLVLDSAIEVTGAERGFIMLADDRGELQFTVARARGGQTLSGSTFETSRRIPEEVLRTGEVMLIADLLDGEMPKTHHDAIVLGIRNVMCVPLRLVRYVERIENAGEERRIGVLYLDSRDKGALLSSSTRAALETLASEAAVAIENARLYRETAEKQKMEQEMRIAAEIQTAWRPAQRLELNFVEAAAYSLPCRSIGADFFDYFGERGGVFSFIVGDVAGKGPPAAFISALMQGMCGLFVQDAEEPGIAVASMNRALLLRRLESRFVSLFFGVLSPDGRLTYCNGGYNAPLIVGAAGTRRLNAGGPALGVLESAGYEQETVQLESGDAVVVWSDGVSRASNSAGQEFGDARVQDEVQSRSISSDPGSIVEQLLGSVRSFTGAASVNDDLTVMVLRYMGKPAAPAGATANRLVRDSIPTSELT
jgi:phosphoserine phosphatase RsbU/P